MRYILLYTLTLLISTTLIASKLSKEEERLYFSMDLLELLETEIGSGTPLLQRHAPAVTSIITSEEIERSGARTIHEILEQIPGLHIYPSNLATMSESISIRGIKTEHNPQILILVDGEPFNNLLNGNAGHGFKMPTSIIHRVEVIRGPGSALYGADAFAGVINIITKGYFNIKDQIGIRYGSFNSWEGWVNSNFDIGENLNIGLALSLMSSDGDNGRKIAQDASAPGSVTLAPGSLSTQYDVAYLHADAHYKDYVFNLLLESSKDIGLGAGHLNILDDVGHINRKKIFFKVLHTNNSWFKDTKIKTKLTSSITNLEPNYVPRPRGITWLPSKKATEKFTFVDGMQGNPYAKERQHSTSINIIHTGIEKHTVNAEIGYKYGKLEPTQTKNFGKGVTPGVLTDITDNSDAVYMEEQTRSSYYFLLQNQFNVNEHLNITTGVRYDNYDDFGSTVNPRFALVWQQSDDVTLKAMYGRAFRAPSFSELYFQNNPSTLGNKNLKPEVIDTFEVALNYQAPIHTKLNIFYYKAKDLIDFIVPKLNAIPVAQNAKDQNGYGLELELEYSITPKIVTKANYSYQHSEDALSNEKIADIPVHQAFFQLDYIYSSNLNINAQYHYIGKRYRSNADIRADLGADSLINITIDRKNIIQGVSALISCRNLFDTDYKEPSSGAIAEDYPMQGRYIYAQIKYSF